MVCASFSGKTYFKLKFLSRIPDRDISIITKTPPEQCSKSETKIKEIGEPLSEYENANIVFDDFLGSPNSKYIDQFFLIGRHSNLDFYYR